ncbi:hypothetical protein E2562_021587 [Oryza meyeriana var. granulata]|uniref:Uncharacterized protein n=1 Tax=Oryza meyeriana var. granulata TaxID=110450 RepID=A0A6G1EY11_9ORYZ|nr:hypothetical protein E2562_021587 [Oryza meyeriana var. granulata]
MAADRQPATGRLLLPAIKLAPLRRDSVGTAKEAELREIYRSFIGEIGLPATQGSMQKKSGRRLVTRQV